MAIGARFVASVASAPTASAIASTPALAAALDPAVLEDGDVILRHAHARWSKYFRDASPIERRFSHVGIIAQGADGPQVIHADASDATGIGCVRSEALATFLARADDWLVVRAVAPPEQRRRIAIEARACLGVPFDARFDLSDASRLYCTELVYLAFERALGPGRVRLSICHGQPLVFLDSCYLGPGFTVVAQLAVRPVLATDFPF